MITLPEPVINFITRVASEKMSSDQIYETLEADLDLRDTIVDLYCIPGSIEPIRNSLNRMGEATGVAELIDY